MISVMFVQCHGTRDVYNGLKGATPRVGEIWMEVDPLAFRFGGTNINEQPRTCKVG